MAQKFVPPDPILDSRELNELERLTKEYEDFTKPGFISRGLTKVGSAVRTVVPERLAKASRDAIEHITEQEIIKSVFDSAGKGFAKLGELASGSSISQDRLLKTLRTSGIEVRSFDEITTVRSYSLTPHIASVRRKHLSYAAAQGAITGAPGVFGIPFNIAASFFLFFRASQTVAMHYGYDARQDPAEAEIASQVALLALDPRLSGSKNHLGSLLGKMALAGELTILRGALLKSTYKQMADKGGSALLYVQLRALANKAAEKALRQSGNKGLEAGVFKAMLESVGKQLPKNMGAKVVPVVGAVLTAGVDTHLMNRVLKGARIIYAKRFLFEKEERLKQLLERKSAPRKRRASTKKRAASKRSSRS